MATTVNQSAVIGRRSASQATTPLSTTPNATGFKGGRSSLSNKPSSDNTCTSCNTASVHAELEAELARIKAVVQELKIICANNNACIQHLKQDNQRLAATVKSMQLTSSSLPISVPSGDDQISSVVESGNMMNTFSLNEPNIGRDSTNYNNNSNNNNQLYFNNNNNNRSSSNNNNTNNQNYCTRFTTNKNIVSPINYRNIVNCDNDNEA